MLDLKVLKVGDVVNANRTIWYSNKELLLKEGYTDVEPVPPIIKKGRFTVIKHIDMDNLTVDMKEGTAIPIKWFNSTEYHLK